MKKYCFIVLLVLFVTSLFAQKVKTKDGYYELKSINDLRYVELICVSKFMSTKVKVMVDFGHNEMGYSQVVNEDGSVMVFNSPVHAFNYMVKEGWEYKDRFIYFEGSQNVVRFLMERKKKHELQAHASDDI